jgi:hypothetical protein
MASTMIFAVLSLLLGVASALERDPQPPVWPQQFMATSLVNRSGALSEVELAYDWPGGRNLLRIAKQQGSVLWDLEWTNGTSFYFDKQAKTCKLIKMPVGILTPDWMANATYLGEETVDGFRCHKWTKVEFVDYWADATTGYPVRWTFLWDGAQNEVLNFRVGETISEESWQAPSYCFEESPAGVQKTS